MFNQENLALKMMIQRLNLNQDIINHLHLKEDTFFKIEKKEDEYYLTYSKHNDLFVGLRIIKEHIKRKSFSIEINKKIDDLTLMVDCSRNAVYKVETIQELIMDMALLGYDSLQLYTEDTFLMEDEPYFGYLRGAYSKEELKSIVGFAKMFGIKVVPCIQTLAHLNGITRYPMYQNIIDTQDILLVDEPKTYVFIEKMIKTMRDIFEVDIINIGMDEAYMLGRGKYLDQHGYKDRFSVMMSHLKKVIDICKQYNFNPMMWSDMFFRMARIQYYDDLTLPEELIQKIPEGVSLIYWDYYNTNQSHYEKMIDKHLQFNKKLIFAGGFWKWIGFTPDNRFSLLSNVAQLKACINKNIKEVIMTAWGDNGAESSLFSILPSLTFTGMAKYGYFDIEDVKKAFKAAFDVNFDDFMKIDLANQVNDNPLDKNSFNKNFLYNDPLLGLMDTIVDDSYALIYENHTNVLKKITPKMKRFKYLFLTQYRLVDLIQFKVDIGVKLRTHYQNQQIDKLKEDLKTLKLILKKINLFYEAFKTQWHHESKVFGFEIQDLRIGGIIQRIQLTIQKVNDYITKNKKIDELEIHLLDYYGKGLEHQKIKNIIEYRYKPIVSVNVNV